VKGKISHCIEKIEEKCDQILNTELITLNILSAMKDILSLVSAKILSNPYPQKLYCLKVLNKLDEDFSSINIEIHSRNRRTR
jgi:hypothetical protein